MTSTAERFYEVGLRFTSRDYVRVGVLHARHDLTWFVVDPVYADRPDRPILGMVFEDDIHKVHRSNQRLPPWFSHLLPEGPLRKIIAKQAGLKPSREILLLAAMGENLPGAVVVRQIDAGLGEPTDAAEPALDLRPRERKFRFSLAGVQHKLSLSSREDRFTLPMDGELDDWIVKFPSREYAHLPRMEFTTMSLAKAVGIDVPEIQLVERKQVNVDADFLWPNEETEAFAIRRFDRDGDRRIHMEDFAQIRNTAGDKYAGSFETMANIAYRQHDLQSLIEFVRRLAFNICLRNGDAHLKNWSLLYRDPQNPVLSPAYDLISTEVYAGKDNVLEPSFGGETDFERIRLRHFGMLARKLKVDVDLVQVASDTCRRIEDAWCDVRLHLGEPHRSAMDAMLAKTIPPLRAE